MSTINSIVSTTVTLGTGNGQVPLTITAQGAVLLDGNTGASAVVANTSIAPGASPNLTNDGLIRGGYGSIDGTIGGGAGVAINGSATIDNAFTISGGGTYLGGTGGVGVSLAAGTLTNDSTGFINGGSGALTGLHAGGSGGIGAILISSLASVGNSGQINGGTGVIRGGGGLGIDLIGGSVTNTGSITGGYVASGAGAGGTGVNLIGGTLTNTGGTISGGAALKSGDTGSGGIGVEILGGTVNNQDTPNFNGVIEGGNALAVGGIGLEFLSGPAFTNDGIIRGGGAYAVTGGVGGTGVVDQNGKYAVINASNIYGGQSAHGTAGVGALVFDSFTNQAGAAIHGGSAGSGGSGGSGAQVVGGGTLTNHGFISGGSDNASGSYGAGVYLNGGTVINDGTIKGLGTGYSVKFGPASGSILDVSSGADFVNPIGGFTVGDKITFTDLTQSVVSGDFDSATHTLTTADGTLIFVGNFTGDTFHFTTDGNGADVTVTAACYRRGTRILTARGELPIERLGVSDLVITASGEHQAVRWLGTRHIDCTRHAHPELVWPIRIRAGAIADHQPSRDLWVSPGHSIVIDGQLLQAEKLVNGTSITQERCDRVDYWHVELDRHDILFAEGLCSESYLDTGNRSAFANGGGFVDAHPDFRPRHWNDTCLPLVLEGPALERAHARVLARAQVLEHSPAIETARQRQGQFDRM